MVKCLLSEALCALALSLWLLAASPTAQGTVEFDKFPDVKDLGKQP